MLCLVAQSCPTLSDPMDCSPPGSSVRGNLQARTLEWVACPPPGDLHDTGIEPTSSAVLADSLPLRHLGSPVTSLGHFSGEGSHVHAIQVRMLFPPTNSV